MATTLELCNCDVLTAFCLFKENAEEQKPEARLCPEVQETHGCHAQHLQ